MTGPEVLLYGDVDLNIIDGSSIWLASIAEVLSSTGASVRLLLKAPVVNDRLVGRLRMVPGIELIAPPASLAGEPLSPRLAARVLAATHHERPADVLLVRGLRICAAVASNENMRRRLWAYVTDIPHTALDPSAPQNELLLKVTHHAHRLFAQTEDARSYLESLYPAAAGKTSLMPPMIPVCESRTVDSRSSDGTGTRRTGSIKLVYAGKLAKDWRTLEILDVPRLLAERYGVSASLDVVGDKVQDDRQDTGWADRMREAVASNLPARSGVTFHGGLPRVESLRIVSAADIGLSWRSPALDGSLEVSTKALEYAAHGVAPLVNDTVAHRRLFGQDYRGYVNSLDAVVDTVASLASDRALLTRQTESASSSVESYRFDAAARRFARLFETHAPMRREQERPRIVVAGHDFKFAADVFSFLDRSGLDYRVDKWSSLREHDEAHSRGMVEWADVVFCEWAGPNAVWYSKNLPSDKRLVARLHGFEVRAPWLPDLDTDRVDSVAFVSDFFREEAVQALGWHGVSTRTISNAVDTVDLDREKSPDARFHLGMLGLVPFLKRPDRAVDLIERLITEDERYVLHIRGRAPWNYAWEWSKEWQRDAYSDVLRRIGQGDLKDHVVVEEFGPDVANWFRQIGWVLSPSTRETFHLASAEGMASGAVPIIWDRPGARSIFGDDWVVDDTDQAVALILGVSEGGRWQELSARAKLQAAGWDIARSREHWQEFLVPSGGDEDLGPRTSHDSTVQDVSGRQSLRRLLTGTGSSVRKAVGDDVTSSPGR